MEEKKRTAIKEGFFADLTGKEEEIRLAGSKCANCGEVFLGRRKLCENCSGETMETIPLGREGILWSYTIIRHEPPPGYKAPRPFAPYAVGLVELPEGIRVLSPIECDVNHLRIGMKLESVVYPLYQNDQGHDVMAFKFKPA